jgi:HCOMODA/2-hydroxy-3-carboxy-muconic semialdehyde decarboxylase
MMSVMAAMISSTALKEARHAGAADVKSAFVVGMLSASLTVIGAAPQTSPVNSPANQPLIDDLVAANRILAQEHIFDGFGHVSVRSDRNANHYFLARSLAPGLVTANDILEFDLANMALTMKDVAQYSERFIHGEIYKARPEVKAIVHNHSPALIPFSVSSVPLRAVSHTAGFIGDGVPIFDIRATAGMTDMLVSTPERGRALAASLKSAPAVLMRGHGVTVVGQTLPIAVGRSIYLERNAMLQTQAIALGGTITYLDPAEARQIVASGENGGYLRAWELWKRKAMASTK